MVLLAVPAVTVAGGFLHVFQFSFLLWPFNLALPLARHLPRVCITLRRAASHYAAELRGYLSGRRRVQLPLLGYQNSTLRGVQRSPEGLVAQTMIGLIDISY